MSGLTKAQLSEITSGQNGTTVGKPVDVQFNPASLKLTLSNAIEGGKTRPQQVRQYVGKASTELSFDLVFDTADEIGADGNPRSVRERTAAVERFVVTKKNGNQKQTPPKVRFQWGNLVLDGIISSVSIDFTLFAPNGVPLRAKMGVTIKEQDSKYMFADAGANPAANLGGDASFPASPAVPGGASTATPGGGVDLLTAIANAADAVARAAGLPGTAGGGVTDRTAAAIAGESLAEFAARNGVPPAAWRAMAGGIDNPLALPAGTEINFDSALGSRSAASNASPPASAPSSVDEALGLDAKSASTLAGGRALAAAGGVSAASATAAASRVNEAVARERLAFGHPLRPAEGGSIVAASSVGQPAAKPLTSAVGAASPIPVSTPGAAAAVLAPVPQQRPPLRLNDEPISRATAATDDPPPAATIPYVDSRALTFGFGIPLRPRLGGAVEVRASLSRGAATLRHRDRAGDAVKPRDPTAPPWVQLPFADAVRAIADKASHAATGRSHCGCNHSTTVQSGGPPCRCTSGK